MSYVSASRRGRSARGIFGVTGGRNYLLSGDVQSTNLLDDLIDAGEGALRGGAREGQSILEGKVGDIANEIIKSSQFKVVLDAVEKKAESGVKKVVAANALGLVGLAIGGGALGGIVLQGKIGVVGAGALMAAALAFLFTVNKPAK